MAYFLHYFRDAACVAVLLAIAHLLHERIDSQPYDALFEFIDGAGQEFHEAFMFRQILSEPVKPLAQRRRVVYAFVCQTSDAVVLVACEHAPGVFG